MTPRVLLLLLLVLLSACFAGADPITYSLGGAVTDPTRGLVEEAVRMTDSPSCGGAVMSRFGVTPDGPPHLILFASLRSVCRKASVLAFTQVKSAAVVLCLPQFNIASIRDRDVALVVLIHELLHTQGLTESPVYPGAPSSLEISRAVRDTCGLQGPETYSAFGKK